MNTIDSIKAYDKKTTLLAYFCKLVKENEPKLKFFFDDLLCMEDALKIELSDIDTKLREHEKGINKIGDECKNVKE